MARLLISPGLAKALTDTYSDCKRLASQLIVDLCQAVLPAKVHRSARLLVPALLANLKHQHWKVRKTTR